MCAQQIEKADFVFLNFFLLLFKSDFLELLLYYFKALKMNYEAPNLDDEAIGSALHNGLLGEQISHITIEQLKVASSPLFLQACVSILQKLDIDTDHFGQHFLQPHLSSPEHYQSSTFFSIHVPRYFYALVPGCTPKVICTLDLLRPKWKRIKKFLSVVINYLRFVETNNEKFQEMNMKSEELHKNVDELQEQNDKLHSAISELDQYLVQNTSLNQQQIKEKMEAEEELKQILYVKKDTDSRKDETKKSIENLKGFLTSIIDQNNQIRKKIEDMKQLVVTSPEKQISEKKDLHHKLELCKDDIAEIRDQIQSEQWNIDKKEEIIKRVGYALKQLSKYQEFYEKLRTLKAGLMKEQYQANDNSMSVVCIKQEIDKLKQLKLDERDLIHRTKMRSEHTMSSLKQRLTDLNKQCELIQVQVQDKEEKIFSIRKALEEQDNELEKVNQSHKEEVEKIEALKNELVKIIEETVQNFNLCVEEITSERLTAFQNNIEKDDQ